LAWQERSSDLALYTALSARYAFEWEKLNELSANVPVYSFPDAPPWKDISPNLI